MATRRVFFAIIAPAEITAGGEGIAMSDKPAQQLRRQKNIPEFSPTAWGTVPPNVGFHSPRQGGDFEVILIVMAFRWKLIRLATFFSTCQPVKYPQIFTFISQYQ